MEAFPAGAVPRAEATLTLRGRACVGVLMMGLQKKRKLLHFKTVVPNIFRLKKNKNQY